jgi:hypothetical protein
MMFRARLLDLDFGPDRFSKCSCLPKTKSQERLHSARLAVRCNHFLDRRDGASRCTSAR